MLTEKIKEVVLLLLLILAITAVQGQQASMTEEDVITRAGELFDQEKWGEALPLYAQLVSVNPEIPEYNYKFGVCTLLGNRSERRRPIRYLNIAYRSMPDNTDLLFYLGLAYYQNQEFANAMKFLNLYLAKLDPNSPQRATILEQINACLNGMNLEHKNLIDEIISKTEFQLDNFYRAYRADDLNGSLILKPENFVSNKEKSSGTKSFVFVSEPRGILYYSGYDDNASMQRDIFKVELKENGDWGKPVRISDFINTNYDEAYPIVTDNGQTLYFSSKGHNSLGGFDIFKSTFDPETEEFSSPENMGIGINSPFDDILFIPDNTGQGAYFSSNRDNLGDAINVFRIRMNQDFGDQHMLAQQSIQTKLEGAVQNQNTSTNSTTEQVAAKKEIIANQDTPVDPQKKADNLLRQRANLNKMADTAYMLVSNMKSQIRDLTNKRDRANMISTNKMDQAKKLEVEFDIIINGLPSAPGKEEFEDQLAQAVTYKEDIYQYRQRADQANLIAWNLGKHIKIKNEELKQLKLDAGEVQTLSLSGDFEKTSAVYEGVRMTYEEADTLTDYAQNIKWINLDKINFDLPETELAFADKMRNGYENQTLLAMTQEKVKQNEKFDETLPIEYVDNRPSAKQPVIPQVAIVKQVEAVNMELAANDEVIIEESELELQFEVDAIDPFQLVVPVSFADIAYNETIPDSEELEIRYLNDGMDPFEIINPLSFEEVAFVMEETDELELNFTIDQVEAAALIEEIHYVESTDDIAFEEESLELNERIDWIAPAILIAPVEFNETAYALQIDEEELLLNDRVDWITPSGIVEQVVFNDEAYALTMEEEAIEIHSYSDYIDAAPVAQQLAFNESEYALNLEDEILEINTYSDVVDAAPVAQQLAFNESEYALNLEDEILEINTYSDVVDATPIIKEVVFDETVYAISIDEELSIDNQIDQLTPEQLVESVPFNEDAYALNMDDPVLELNQDVDFIEPAAQIEAIAFQENEGMDLMDDEIIEISNVADQVDAAPLVEAIAFQESNMDIGIDEDALEVSNTIDYIIPAELVQTVAFNDPATFEVEIEDVIEINNTIDVVDAAPVVSAIAFQEDEFTMDSEVLEINTYNDGIEAAELVEQIAYQGSEILVDEQALEISTLETTTVFELTEAIAFQETDTEVIPIEDLEIRIEEEQFPAYAQVDPVQLVTSGPNASGMQEEELELDFSYDTVEALALVSPVHAGGFVSNDVIVEEELELNFEEVQQISIAAAELVQMVEFTDQTLAISAEDEALEFNFVIDEPEAMFEYLMIQPVAYTDFSFTMPNESENLELSFGIDEATYENLTADNAAISERDMVGIQEAPSTGTELYYLRESVSLSANIETSRSDIELLMVAIESPDDLSYEELLFAASIAPVPEDKLRIYNYAFIHIDRDWRAFNNAAVTAMNIKDLDQAEVYLYQASLISDDNGKVENNMGILACYKNDFLTAETHFLAANQMGVNADYNLQLIQNLVNTSQMKTGKFQREIGKTRINK